MKKKILMTTVTILAIVGIVFANSEIGVEKNGNLTNYYAKKDPVRYAQSLTQLSDKEKQKLYEYVKANPDKAYPVMYIALADYIYKTNKDDALFWYFVGRIRTYEDVMMCNDESAKQQMAYYPSMAEKTMEYFRQLGPTASKLMAKAVDWDEAHPKRINPKWTCYHGMEVFTTGDVTIKPLSEYPKVQKEYRDYIKASLKKQ